MYSVAAAALRARDQRRRCVRSDRIVRHSRHRVDPEMQTRPRSTASSRRFSTWTPRSWKPFDAAATWRAASHRSPSPRRPTARPGSTTWARRIRPRTHVGSPGGRRSAVGNTPNAPRAAFPPVTSVTRGEGGSSVFGRRPSAPTVQCVSGDRPHGPLLDDVQRTAHVSVQRRKEPRRVPRPVSVRRSRGAPDRRVHAPPVFSVVVNPQNQPDLTFTVVSARVSDGFPAAVDRSTWNWVQLGHVGCGLRRSRLQVQPSSAERLGSGRSIRSSEFAGFSQMPGYPRSSA